MSRSRSLARRSSRSMSRPTGRLRIWWFGYAMCTRPVELLRVSYGVLNLTHRDGHEQPAPLAIGERYRVRIQLNDAGSVFPAGHKVRLALSTAYWPMIWPSPETATAADFGWHARSAATPAQAADAQLSPLPGRSRRHRRTRRSFVAMVCGSSASTASVLKLGTRRVSPGFTSRGRPLSAVGRTATDPDYVAARMANPRPDARCGCHARAMPSCCREVCAPSRARTKSVVATGIALFLEISYDRSLTTKKSGARAAP